MGSLHTATGVIKYTSSRCKNANKLHKHTPVGKFASSEFEGGMELGERSIETGKKVFSRL